MSSPLELVIAEAIVRGLRNFDREDEAIGGSGSPEFVPAPTPIWNAKLLGRSAENYIPLLTDFGLQLTRSETRHRLTLIQRSPSLTLNPTNASTAQLDEAASHFLSIGVPSPQRSGGTVSRSDLVEGTMSQTGAKTHHSDADEASKVIEERLRLIIDTIPTIVWRKLPDGSADFLNQHFREYTGLSLAAC